LIASAGDYDGSRLHLVAAGQDGRRRLLIAIRVAAPAHLTSGTGDLWVSPSSNSAKIQRARGTSELAEFRRGPGWVGMWWNFTPVPDDMFVG